MGNSSFSRIVRFSASRNGDAFARIPRVDTGTRKDVNASVGLDACTRNELKRDYCDDVSMLSPTQTGEGVKTARKGTCAQHVSAVAAFLKVRVDG